MVCLLCCSTYLFLCFCRARVGFVGRHTEGSLFWTDCRSTSECLDSASVWFSVTKPILVAMGSVSNFLFGCTPVLSVLLSALAPSFHLSLSWWRHLGKPKWQLTSSLIILNWPHKVALSYEQFSPCISLFTCFLFVILALSVFLPCLKEGYQSMTHRLTHSLTCVPAMCE